MSSALCLLFFYEHGFLSIRVGDVHMNVLKVGVHQFMPKCTDLRFNLEKIERSLSEAQEKGIELLVFPEMGVTGYQLEDHIYDLCLSDNHPILRQLIEMAGQFQLDYVIGFPYVTDNGTIFNVAGYFHKDGRYDLIKKIMLPNFSVFNEKRYFRSGSETHIVNTSFGKVGVLTCYDIYAPEIARSLVKQGAILLIIPSASPGIRQAYFESLIAARSIENTVPVIYVNQSGISPPLNFWGGSEIRDAWGARVLKLLYDTEDRGDAQIDLKDVQRARSFLPSPTEMPELSEQR